MAITPEHFAAEQGPTLLRTAQKNARRHHAAGHYMFQVIPRSDAHQPAGMTAAAVFTI